MAVAKEVLQVPLEVNGTCIDRRREQGLEQPWDESEQGLPCNEPVVVENPGDLHRIVRIQVRGKPSLGDVEKTVPVDKSGNIHRRISP